MLDSDESELVCPLGTVLRGKYRLDRVLGIGGMAVVYAATHRNQKRFAIKMLHAELSLRQDVRARFLREGYAANTVDHPGAVAVLDDDVADNGAAFLVMELLDGDSVEHLWERHGRRIPLGAALTIGHHLADVLAAAHAKAIVHRDIKPANLFVTREGQLKVLDFGIARVRDAAISGAQATGTGLVLGTPAFMAPEQALAKSHEIDARTDVWAAGATLFALLTGRNVHEGDNGQQVLIRAATTPATSLAAVVPDAPRSVVALIDRALAFDKTQRWPSAEALRDATREAHVSLLGRAVSRDSLAPLLSERDPRVPPTQYSEPFTPMPLAAPDIDQRTMTPDSETLDQADRARLRELTSAQRHMDVPSQSPIVDATGLGYSGEARARGTAPMNPPPSLAGGTTSRPISSDRKFGRPAGVPSHRLWLIGLAFAGLASVGGIVALTMSAMTGTAPAATVSASVAPSPSPGSSQAAQAATNPVPVALTPIASVVASATSAAPSSNAPPTRAIPPPAIPRQAAPAVAATQSPRSQCNPPYTLDPQTGIKHWKHECL